MLRKVLNFFRAKPVHWTQDPARREDVMRVARAMQAGRQK